MSKKDRIRELEVELRILYNEIYVVCNKSGRHAHHNKKYLRFCDILSELESISIKWKIKKIIRRIKYHG